MYSLLITAALATGAPFEAQPLAGDVVSGELKALSAKELVLETAAGPVTLPLARLASLAPQTPGQPSAAAAVRVELLDDSLLPAGDYAAAKGQARLSGPGDTVQEVPTAAIRSVRFETPGGPTPAMDKQWAEIRETKAAGDLLVVRKDDALDYLEGVVGEINAETCQFELDGETIPVRRAKIAGIVYAHPATAELPEPVGQLATIGGARLQLKAIELSGDLLKIQTTAGTSHEVPLADVARFDFTSGKIAFLSDLEPESVTFTPLVGFEQPPQGLLGFYEYRRDVGFEQSPLRLDGKVFAKGLALATRTELVYKLPGKFRLFRSTVGIDDSTRETGSVRLSIKGDGKVLWEGDVRGTEPVQQLELDVAGVRRLEILADYGAGLDVGDRLDLGDAQVTK